MVLDAGTGNQALLDDPLYVGNWHSRVRGGRYDELIGAYVATATAMFPHAMLHWEDFGAANAHRILARYAGSCCTFNDDIQGTAAVVLAAALGAVRAAGTSMADQTVVIHGAGTAGIGIADVLRQVVITEGLPVGQAASRFWALGSRGLLTSVCPGTMRDFQVPYARQAAEVARWRHDGESRIDLAEAVARTCPTMLIGTSTQLGMFSQDIVTEMAAHTERPIIMPLSNPTSLSEAPPADLIAWTGGRALIATGSPFEPVSHDGVRYEIAQANNVLIFPGLGLGSPSPGPAGSATACWPPRPLPWPVSRMPPSREPPCCPRSPACVRYRPRWPSPRRRKLRAWPRPSSTTRPRRSHRPCEHPNTPPSSPYDSAPVEVFRVQSCTREGRHTSPSPWTGPRLASMVRSVMILLTHWDGSQRRRRFGESRVSCD